MAWKYIDVDGQDVFDMTFDRARPFCNGLAAVRANGNWHIIDRSGQDAISQTYEAVGDFRSQITYAKVGGKFGVIDRTGKFVIPPKFGSVIGAFECGLATVDVDGKTGYIDTSGEFVIPPRYKFAESFSEEYAVVCNPDDYFEKWFIDKRGSNTFGPFNTACSFSEGVAGIYVNDACRFIDREGREVLVMPKRVHAEYFREGLAATQFSDRKDDSPAQVTYGYIDTRGETVIPPRFDLAHRFENGVACVKVGELEGLITLNGEWLIEPRYKSIDRPFGGRIRIDQNGKTGFLDEQGNVVIEPIYLSGWYFSEGVAPVSFS